MTCCLYDKLYSTEVGWYVNQIIGPTDEGELRPMACEWTHIAVGQERACLGAPTAGRSQECRRGTREGEDLGCFVQNHCTKQASITYLLLKKKKKATKALVLL